MKKFFITFAALAVSVCAFAQTQKPELEGFGVILGFNISNLNSDLEIDFKSRTSINIGVVYDHQIDENFYIQPGLYYKSKGAKEELNTSDYGASATDKYKARYFQVPILASYRLDLENDRNLSFDFGPYLAYGVSGKIKTKVALDSDSVERDYFGDDGIAKRFDFGFCLGAGIHLTKEYYMGLAYDFGLLNISKLDGVKLRNRTFSINLGYNF